jgi:cellulose biosynthesis protein BcsQ
MGQDAGVLTVTVISLKGGVGKTSVALGLAGAAVARGLRTLLIDLDPQGNASLALDPQSTQFTSNDVLADARAGVLAQAVTPSAWDEALLVVPSETALEHRNHPVQGRGGEHRLRTTMQGLAGFDLVLVDTPPSLGELTKNALAASDRAVVVTEPTAFALTGAQQALTAVDVVRGGFNLRLRAAGIIVNRYRARSAEHRYRHDELVAAYGPLVLEPVLPERSAVVAAAGAHVPVQRWPSPGAREIARALSTHLTTVVASAAGPDAPLTKGLRG